MKQRVLYLSICKVPLVVWTIQKPKERDQLRQRIKTEPQQFYTQPRGQNYLRNEVDGGRKLNETNYQPGILEQDPTVPW